LIERDDRTVVLPNLSNVSSRIDTPLLRGAKRAWSSIRFDRRSGSAPGRSPIERASRALFDSGDRSPARRSRRTDHETRVGAELAVLGRAALFALATIAGTTDPDGNARRNGDSGIDRAEGDAGEKTDTLGRRLRESGPVVLVPLAWSFAIAAHLGRLEDRTVLIAHLVMDCILAAFAAASWSEMDDGVLRAWKLVLLVGLGFTLLGTSALLGRDGSPSSEDETAAEGTGSVRTRALALTVQAWLLVPAAGLAYTGLNIGEDEGPGVYLAGAVCSLLGSLTYASAPTDSPAATRKLLGLALANVGQTAGIANAVYQY
jgi:hypothetical protein